MFGVYSSFAVSLKLQNIIVSTPLGREFLICTENISPINTF